MVRFDRRRARALIRAYDLDDGDPLVEDLLDNLATCVVQDPNGEACTMDVLKRW